MNAATQINTTEATQTAQNVTFERTNALAAMKAAIMASDPKSTYPMLGNAKIEFCQGVGAITCHNLDVEICAQFATDSTNSGSTVINAKDLEKLLSKLKADQFNIEFGDNATLTDGKRSYALPSEDIDLFPMLRQVEAQSTLIMPAQSLFHAIERVKGAMGRDEFRSYLNGMFLEHDAGNLHFVATDGHCLYRQTLAQNADNMPSIIIPSDTVKMLEKILKGQSGSVAIDVSDERLVVRVGDVTIRSKLVEGTFPNYRGVIPNFEYSDAKAKMKVDQSEFLQAIKDVSILATAKAGEAVILNAGDNGLTLQTNVNDAISETTIRAYGYLPHTCGYKRAYLSELLTVCGAGTITYQSEGPGSPCLITSDDAEGWQGVLMPQKI
jgi:DNA polymerase-3 subunit beta